MGLGTPTSEGVLKGAFLARGRHWLMCFSSVSGYSPHPAPVAPLLREGGPEESTEEVKKRELGVLRTERGRVDF